MFSYLRIRHMLPHPLRQVLDTISDVVAASFADEVEERSAALAFHVILALVPLLFLLLLVGGVFLSDQVVIRSIVDIASNVLDKAVGDYLEGLLHSMQALRGIAVASLISTAILLFAASRAIYHFRSAFYFILLGEAHVHAERSVGGFVRYVGSMVILVIVLLLVVLLILFKSIVSAVVAHGGVVALVGAPLVGVFGSSLALVLVWFTLATVYRLVSKGHTTLQSQMAGSLIAAILVTILNEFFTFILADISVITYGVASSLVGLMLWSYYTVMAILIGAEIAKVLARKLPDERIHVPTSHNA